MPRSKEDRPAIEVVSSYQPAGDQPAAIAAMVQGLEEGLAHQTLLGVTGSGKTFSIANVISQVQRPTLVLAPNKTLAAQLYGEFREFFPHNSVEYFVSYYDYYQPEAYVPASDTYMKKIRPLTTTLSKCGCQPQGAARTKDSIIVASVSAIYGLGDPESYFQMVLHLDRGDRLDQRAILQRLTELQYTVMTWRFSAAPTVCVATSLTCFLRNRKKTRCVFRYLMTK